MNKETTKMTLSGMSRVYRAVAMISLLLVLLPAVFVSTATAQTPQAGTTISGLSSASFEMSGNYYVVSSNEVFTVILPVYGLSLLPDGTALAPAAEGRAFSGETLTFPFTLGNTGNTDDTFDLTIESLSPSGFIPLDPVVYLDVDGDGVVDPGEIVVTDSGILNMGGSISLVMSAVLPDGLTGGEVAHLDLVARSRADTSLVDRGNVVRLIARDEARVSVSISSDRATVLPGEDVSWTVDFSNDGERTATDVVITDFIDYSGMSDGTQFIPGSLFTSLPGTVEYFDIDLFDWVEVAPPADRIKGARLRLETLAAGSGGSLTFDTRVDPTHRWGDIFNAASADYTGGDSQLYSLDSNEISVLVGQVSALAFGPAGYPDAPEGSLADRVVVTMGSADSVCTFWHELRNDGNYIDTIRVSIADSLSIPAGWGVEFIDGNEDRIEGDTPFLADLGAVDIGQTRTVGVRFRATPENFRVFSGRELELAIESRSLVDPGSVNGVLDVLVKSDMPILSVTQSIREPNAMTGDILSFIITIENLTDETTVDSVMIVESMSPGLGYAGGSDDVVAGGNTLSWNVGSLGPGEKREVVFRASVKAGQERGELVSSAWVYGVSSLGERTSDGPALASIRLIEGVFSRKGLIFGSVFEDLDDDGLRGEGEKGVAGVSVILENGTRAVTDSAGLYSIPSVLEGRHVVRIDPKTLPDGLSPGRAGYFGLGVRGEYLIDLAPSGNRRVEFPLNAHARYTREDSSAAIGGSGPEVIGSIKGAEGEDGVSGSSEEAGDPVLVRGGEEGGALAGIASEAGKENNSGAGGTGAVLGEGYAAITFPSSFFEAGSAVIEDIPIREVAALGLWMREHDDWKIMVSGHTDSIPIATAEFPSNFELSLARARSVFQLLRMNGIPEKMMDYSGYGSRVPIATNDTEEGRSLNRRVEIKVIPPEGYEGQDPQLPEVFARPDTTRKEYSLADDAGICAEIVKPDEGHVFSTRDAIDVEVLSPLASAVELYVNSIPVGREKLGQKQIDVANGTIGYIFYDVRIKEGRNDILVVCRSQGEKNVCVRHVYLAGRPSSISSERERVEVAADGQTSPELVFLVSDRSGLPVRDGLFVDVTGPEDLLRGSDVNPHQPGIQAVTSKGRVSVSLAPCTESRHEKVIISTGDLSAGVRVSYDSPMREWFLFGYGETDIGYSNLTGSGDVNRSFEKHHDGLFAEGKFSLYGQGEVASGHLMTFAIDSRPVREDILLGKVEPEKHYPVYGDASELKYNTASRSGTYLNLENRNYSAMLGDFQTDLSNMEFTRYDRTINGLKGEYRRGKGKVSSFVTRTDQSTYQQELRADGTSGFYFLERYPLIENSEKIRIEVRDRYRPEQIVRVDYMQVHRDYDINYMDGSILFKQPVSSLDDSLNPVWIIVSYECRDAGEVNFLYGLRSTYEIADSLEAGATVIIEEEGVENSSIIGVDISGKLGGGVSMTSEYAHSDKFLLGGGSAFRTRLTGIHSNGIKWNTYYRDIDENFFNPSFSGGKRELGSRKLGADLDWGLSPKHSIISKIFRDDFREKDEKKRYLDVRGLYRDGPVSASFGFAGARRSARSEGQQTAVMLVGSGSFKKGRTKGELQIDQKVGGEEVEEYPNRIQAALSQRLWKHLSGTLRHEYRSGRRSGARHMTQLGVESDITEDLNLYSRYRMEGSVSGERGQAVVGLKNRFKLSDGLSGTFTAEKTSTVSGNGADDFTALATGWLYTPAQNSYKVKGDYEIRFEDERVKHLAGLSGLRRLGGRWTGLLKGDLWYSNEKIELDRVKGSSTLGISYRPKETSRLTILYLTKTRYEKNSPAHPGAVDKDLTILTEANYILGPEWELEGKLGARWVNNTFKSYTASTSSFLYQVQAIRKFGMRWDVTFSSRIVHQRETGTTRFGGGLTLGRVMAENVWVGCGYDFGGHRDADTPVNDFSRNGFHFGMKLKFNEKILEHFYNRGD